MKSLLNLGSQKFEYIIYKRLVTASIITETTVLAVTEIAPLYCERNKRQTAAL